MGTGDDAAWRYGMVDGGETPALDDTPALEHFFADLTRKPARAIHRGVVFETHYYGSPNLLAALLLGWWYGLVDRLFKKRRGFYLRIRLPESLDCDLWMESRWKRIEGNFPARSFSWTAIEPDAVPGIFSGRAGELLEELDASFRMVITDELVQLGPLPSATAPDEMAKALQRGVELALALGASRAAERELLDESEPDREESGADLAGGDAESVPATGPEDGQEAVHAPSRVVHRCTDALEAELTQGVLARAGIPSRVVGTRTAALLGAAPHIFRLKVVVPAERADAAFQVLQAAPPGDGPEAPADPAARKRRPVAFGIAFFLPGAAHFYALRPLTGLLLGLCGLGGLVAALVLGEPLGGGLLLGATVLADLTGAQVVFGRVRRGQPASGLRQVLAGLLLAVLALGASWGLAVWLDNSRPTPFAVPEQQLLRYLDTPIEVDPLFRLQDVPIGEPPPSP